MLFLNKIKSCFKNTKLFFSPLKLYSYDTADQDERMKIEGCVRKKLTATKSENIMSTPSFNTLNGEDLKFETTIDFVRAYLDNVVQLDSPFGNREQNKLTFEVIKFFEFYPVLISAV